MQDRKSQRTFRERKIQLEKDLQNRMDEIISVKKFLQNEVFTSKIELAKLSGGNGRAEYSK
jgi:hypothetical protein